MTITRSLLVLSLMASASLVSARQTTMPDRCGCSLKHRPKHTAKPKQKRVAHSTAAAVGTLRCPCSHYRPRPTAKPKQKLSRIKTAVVAQLRCPCSLKHHPKQKPSKPARAK